MISEHISIAEVKQLIDRIVETDANDASVGTYWYKLVTSTKEKNIIIQGLKIIQNLQDQIDELKKVESFHKQQNYYQLAEWDRMTWTKYEALLKGDFGRHGY